MQLIRSLKLASLLVLTALPVAKAQDIGHEIPADTLAKYSVYDTDLLPPSFNADRRAVFLDSMSLGSAALFAAAPERTRANDINYLYHQDPNLYYLSGCWEPESALLLLKEPMTIAGKSVREVLFVRSRNPMMETWTGKRLGPQGAMSVLRVPLALPTDSLLSVMTRVFAQSKLLYFHPAKIDEPVFSIDTAQRMPIYPDVQVVDPSPVLAHMRMIKHEPELRLMRKAVGISNEAHNLVIRETQPGYHEYNIQAIAESTFTANGAEYTGYPCIVGSGPNSTVLHYETNRREIQSGDFIEMDMGAEYHGYSADVTRSFPVARHFSPEQREIYDLVLEAQDSGIRECQVGANFFDAHRAAVRVITRGLLKLGIIADSLQYRRYFMHGTSHFLGLDVHDAGDYRAPLEAGVVMTVEPGVYISAGSPCDKKWWNIGCRIEDDILVTSHGPEILSLDSPRSLSGIEQLRSKSK